MMPEIFVFGAGDEGSLELRGLLAGAGYHVEFCDIRGDTGAENRTYLQRLGLQQIPQVFRHDGRHIGNYENALTELGL